MLQTAPTSFQVRFRTTFRSPLTSTTKRSRIICLIIRQSWKTSIPQWLQLSNHTPTALIWKRLRLMLAWMQCSIRQAPPRIRTLTTLSYRQWKAQHIPSLERNSTLKKSLTNTTMMWGWTTLGSQFCWIETWRTPLCNWQEKIASIREPMRK